jgi:hypothetical protein
VKPRPRRDNSEGKAGKRSNGGCGEAGRNEDQDAEEIEVAQTPSARHEPEQDRATLGQLSG